MKSFLASVLILVIVFALVFFNYSFLNRNIQKLKHLENRISRSDGEYKEEKNKAFISDSLKKFEKNYNLFCFSYKKNLIDNPKKSLEKMLILIDDENYSEYLVELEEYSFHLEKLKSETCLNWRYVF